MDEFQLIATTAARLQAPVKREDLTTGPYWARTSERNGLQKQEVTKFLRIRRCRIRCTIGRNWSKHPVCPEKQRANVPLQQLH